MSNLTSSLVAETETLKEAYAALNRNDIPAMVRAFDPDIEWIEPADYPGGGTHRGLAAVQTLLTKARAGWAEGGCEPERFVTTGADKIVVFIYVRVRQTDRTEWVEGRHASVYTFCNGKAVQMRIFDDGQEALEWAGA